VRGSDLVCRISGDEFLLLLREAASVDSVQIIVQRMLGSLSEVLELASGQQASVSASVGVAMFPQDGDSFDELVRHADMAMYQAKQAGRARYSFYQADMDAALAARLEMERELAEALNLKLVQRALRLEGTCTGEHGIGLHKMGFLVDEAGAGTVELMRQINVQS